MNPSELSLQRLLPRLEARFAAHPDWAAFRARLERIFPRLFGHLLELYGTQYDFFYHLEDLLNRMAQAWLERPSALKTLDAEREANPEWFQSREHVAATCYADLFAGDLRGLQAKIPYLQELGLTFLHLMPPFKTRPGENDGGYAVSDYRAVDPRLGTLADLRALAEALRQAGIHLILDFVLNHTADDHPWAQRARQGDPLARQFYWIFPNREMPDRYEQHLREIFPEEHPGAFSPFPLPQPSPLRGEGVKAEEFPLPQPSPLRGEGVKAEEFPLPLPSPLRGEGVKAEEFPLPQPSPLRGEGVKAEGSGEWVWTTFHTYQWDLNYRNMATFVQMADEMLFLANLGADVLRFDALAFIWKELGTACESLPGAHTLIRAFNAVARIAAPGLLFLSEAIVHPDEVAAYIAPEECQLSYNPLQMALLWNTLATREVNLLEQALRERHALPPGTAWVNYVRCHDDIGWTFSDEDAARLGINGYDHRQFLNAFYTGRFPGSFARGLPFQENPKTGDCRISGTCASLAGLEKALQEEGPDEVELALRRILLIHGIILTSGGIPLIYLGDELATLNDYAFAADPAKADDSRWVHRIPAAAEREAARHDPGSIPGRLYAGLRQLIALRKALPALDGNELQVIPTGNPHVLGYVRRHGGTRALIFANFSEQPQTLDGDLLRRYGLALAFHDLLTDEIFAPAQPLPLDAFQLRILQTD